MKARLKWSILIEQYNAEVNAKDSVGITPLHIAVAAKSPEIVQFLIAHQADINAQVHEGMTPLHDAVIRKDTEMVALLLQLGVTLGISDLKGSTALQLVVKQKNKTIIRMLMKATSNNIMIDHPSYSYKRKRATNSISEPPSKRLKTSRII